MKRDFNRLDGLLHEIRARCTGRDDRELMRRILQEHLITLESEDITRELQLEEPLNLDLEPFELDLDFPEIKIDFQDLELEHFDPCPKRGSRKDDKK